MKPIIAALLTLLPAITLAQNEKDTVTTDSISSRQLEEVVVEAQMQTTSATKSTYIPTSKQKNASQTGIDLLGRMGIPQLKVLPGISGSVQTMSGQDVAIFIDGLPASSQEISGMRMTDVKRVEYLEYPEDPRYQGKAHVVNFVMQQYEYGGYIKALSKDFLIANAYNLNLYTKIQYKRMTYDVAVGGHYMSTPHSYSNSYETFRLPQDDGLINEVERRTTTTDSRTERAYMWPTVKALYQSDNVTIRNTIGTTFDHYPIMRTSGHVDYSPSDYIPEPFNDKGDSRVHAITYNGEWNFSFNKRNQLVINPQYSYSHTSQNSTYNESGIDFVTNAKDDSYNANLDVSYRHSFGKAGSLSAVFNSSLVKNRTSYTGNTETLVNTTLWNLVPSVGYNYNTNKFNGRMAAGFIWDKSVQAEVKETSSSPFANISLRYSFSNRHQAYLFGSYYIASPTGEYRNSTLIQQNKLMSYTGNQYLTANHHYEAAFNYTWLPSNKLNITAFSQLTSIGNRYSYRYEANATGIRRTIDQPVGAYTSSFTGANATLRLFNNSVNIMGYAAYRYTHDGLPNNFNKSYIDYQLSVAYYVGNWDFLCFYTSKTSSSAGPLTGVWAKTPDSYTVQVGYGNSDWSISAYLYNFLRWNWRDSKSYISTPNYSSVNQQYNVNSHAFVYLSASYTFGFGKKINHENEATQQKGAASGILK